jgi:hypothetical protein
MGFDPSLGSFLFTVKNAHGFPPRRFAIRREMKDAAIDVARSTEDMPGLSK